VSKSTVTHRQPQNTETTSSSASGPWAESIDPVISRAPELKADLSSVPPTAADSDEASRRSEDGASASQSEPKVQPDTQTQSDSPTDTAKKASAKEPGDGPDGLPRARMIPAAAVLLMAIIASVLDASMSNVALPTIAQELHINPALVVWITIAYSMTIVVTLLPLSAMAERVGLGRMFAVGAFLFMLASLGASMAVDFPMLLGARIAQGLGSSMLMCLFGGLVRNIYPLRLLGIGLSLNAMTVSMTAVLAPSIGAFILELGNWRWIFWITVPISAVLVVGARYLPTGPRSTRPFDWWAGILVAPVFGLSILGLDLIATRLWVSILCFIIAILSARVLLRRSKRQVAPLVPVDLLRITPVAYAVAASAFSFASQMAGLVSMPFYFQKVMGLSYSELGLYLGAWSLGVGLMAPLSGYLSGRISIAKLCAVGGAGMALGMGWLMFLDAHSHFGWVLASMITAGAGFGLFQTPNNRALLAGVPRHRAAAAGGMQATTRVYGQSFGTALVAIAFTLGGEWGPMLGIGVSVVCAMGSVVVNIMRHLNPASDPILV